MKLFYQILSSILLLSIPLLLVESSDGFKITRGSSISTSSSNESNGTYWLSPSGNIAFGFYPLCSGCQQYVAGVWFVNAADNVLVWSANRNDPPLNHPSSILLNNEGKLILQTANAGDKPLLLDVWEPVSYAMMHDNGNFVLYGYNSRTIWESFNNPTDTILSGQKLNVGQTLIARVNYFDRSYGRYMLKVNQYRQRIVRYKRYKSTRRWETSPRTKGDSLVSLKLDSTGRLHIANSNDSVLRIYTNGENQQWQQQEQELGSRIDNSVIYRATLENDGGFCLYRNKIGRKGEKSVEIWDLDKIYFSRTEKAILITICVICILAMCSFILLEVKEKFKFEWPTIPNWLKIKSGKKDPKVSLKQKLSS